MPNSFVNAEQVVQAFKQWRMYVSAGEAQKEAEFINANATDADHALTLLYESTNRESELCEVEARKARNQFDYAPEDGPDESSL